MSKLKMIMWPVFTLIMFCIALFFNYTASTGLVSGNRFVHSAIPSKPVLAFTSPPFHVSTDLDVGEVSDEFGLEITPAGWTFSIWGFIYIWYVQMH